MDGAAGSAAADAAPIRNWRLYGRYVVSKRLAEERFEFRFAGLREALTDLLRRAG